MINWTIDTSLVHSKTSIDVGRFLMFSSLFCLLLSALLNTSCFFCKRMADDVVEEGEEGELGGRFSFYACEVEIWHAEVYFSL